MWIDHVSALELEEVPESLLVVGAAALEVLAHRRHVEPHDLVVVGEHDPARFLVPEGGEEMVEVAREQCRAVGGEAARRAHAAARRGSPCRGCGRLGLQLRAHSLGA